MKTFTGITRISVSVYFEHAALHGKKGIVRRLRHSDNGAWIEMDEPLPDDLRSFHDESDSRFKHIVLYPEECLKIR